MLQSIQAELRECQIELAVVRSTFAQGFVRHQKPLWLKIGLENSWRVKTNRYKVLNRRRNIRNRLEKARKRYKRALYSEIGAASLH